jgi:hypothetical protein
LFCENPRFREKEAFMLKDQTVKELRNSGYSVVIFSPEELKGINLYYFEDELVGSGWEIIDGMRQEQGKKE